MNKELEKEFPISPEDRVIEECAELIQAILKAKRFGYDSVNPYTGMTNYSNLILELEDVRVSLTNLKNHVIFSGESL